MNCLKGEIIKEMEAKAKRAIDQKEYTMGNVLVNAEQLLSLIYEVKVKDIIIILNQEERNVHSN